MIKITRTISIGENELHFDFIRASGPGGQNVNKVATAAQLRFDAVSSPSLPEEVRDRLIRLAGRRLNSEGVLVITARRFRTRERNRLDAIQRLVELIRRASVKPKIRRKTKPSRKSKERRLETKRQRSDVKRLRKTVEQSSN